MNVYTALPEGLSQLFAGLGIFAAVMAVMAVGTEVVVEMLKSMLGLKSKVTAMEAFNELKAELPGLLAGAGVDAQARQKILDLADLARSKLKPVEDAEKAIANLQKGNLFEAYEALVKLQTGIQAPDVAHLREIARDKLSQAISGTLGKLGLNASLAAALEQNALALIDRAKSAQEMDALIKGFFGGFQNLFNTLFQNSAATERWLLDQMDKYITQGEAGLQTFVNDTIETLAGLGFNVAESKAWLKQALEAVEHSARDKSQVFAHSVRNLLNAVEYRRNEIQSPARMLWRRLRESHVSLWFFDIFLLGLPLGLIFGVAQFNPIGDLIAQLDVNLKTPLITWSAAILAGLLTGVILWVVSLFLSLVGPEAAQMRARQAGPPPGSLGHYLRFTVERLYNRFMGRGSNVVDPARYGDVSEPVTCEVDTVSPTTVASTLLSRENVHQDEETRRVRALRVLSAFIGTLLAYYMRIDAAVYLGYAVPDVVEQINRVDFAVLHAKWPLIPADLSVGILLTGLAASAGSKFWRDLLGRLQSARSQAEEAARTVERVKSALPK